MRHILIGVGLAAVWPDFSETQAASFPASRLTGSGVPAVDGLQEAIPLHIHLSKMCQPSRNSRAAEDVAGDSLAEKYAVLSLSLAPTEADAGSRQSLSCQAATRVGATTSKEYVP